MLLREACACQAERHRRVGGAGRRNAAEAAYMRAVADWLPHAVPRILAEDPDAGLFAMEYLPPEDFPLWKAQLLDDRVDVAFAAAVGRDLARIHALSAVAPDLQIAFRARRDIRSDPDRALPACDGPRASSARRASRGARRANACDAARAGSRRREPEEHPLGASGPVFLDAECAWFGDPAFDLAFCPNHLLLKGAREGADRALFLAASKRSPAAYLAGVDWEDAIGLEARAASLLPALFLARVDGKSPVEYLTEERERDAVRRCAVPLIAEPPHASRGRRRSLEAAPHERSRNSVADRAPRLGLPRPADGRGGGRLERRRGRPRHRAGRRLARQPRGGRPARRRDTARRLRRARRARRNPGRDRAGPDRRRPASIRPRSTTGSSRSTARQSRRGSAATP